MVNPTDAVKNLIARKGYSQTEVAQIIGSTKQNLNNKITSGSIRADDWMKILDAIGIDVVFVDRETGAVLPATEITYKRGYGPPTKGVFDGVKYDTQKADAISNTFFLDGKNEYCNGRAEELYLDRNGRYFIVAYKENGKSKITAVSPMIAAAFVEKYGNKDEPNPNEEDQK